MTGAALTVVAVVAVLGAPVRSCDPSPNPSATLEARYGDRLCSVAHRRGERLVAEVAAAELGDPAITTLTIEEWLWRRCAGEGEPSER